VAGTLAAPPAPFLDMPVEHRPIEHRFVLPLAEGEAVLDYRLASPNVMEMYHTFVPHSARGRGAASSLVTGALDYARANGLRVIPACSYVASFVESHPEYADIVDNDDDASERPAPACEI
jgi:predicted GNAT family acetyltransferase